jgi:hypothetical protein
LRAKIVVAIFEVSGFNDDVSGEELLAGRKTPQQRKSKYENSSLS